MKNNEWIDWDIEYKDVVKWLLDNSFTIIKMDATRYKKDVLIARKLLSNKAGIEITIEINQEQREFYNARLFSPKVYNGIPLLAPQLYPCSDDPMYTITRQRTKFVSFKEFMQITKEELDDDPHATDLFCSSELLPAF